MGAKLWTALTRRSSGDGASPAPRLSEQDALALCETGDLLLARDALEHRALRLRLELAVARDVGRVQRGRFPTQLATALPAWTSCELLVRHGGQLLALRVQADGLQLSPFRDRVRGAAVDGSRLALRRLQRGISTAALRQLVEELAPRSPFRWQQLLLDSAESPAKRQQTPPLLAGVLSRALEVPAAGSGAVASAALTLTLVTRARQLWKASMAAARRLDGSVDAETEDVDASDAVGMLGAALAAAVYERLGVLSLPPVETPLVPTAFASALLLQTQWTPPDALGAEMRVTR